MLIVDTGPLLATADTADPDHAACLALLEGHPGPLIATLDHRDFRVIRPAHTDALELIP